jgi:hypothetical protein
MTHQCIWKDAHVLNDGFSFDELSGLDFETNVLEFLLVMGDQIFVP